MLRVTWRQRPDPMWDRPADMPEMIYELLLRRGVESAEEAQAFLYPDRAQIRDPFLLPDMDRAAERIRRALRDRERVCVYGDYDADGVCATAILLSQLRKMGLDCDYYIPSRHREGYGLNEAAIREIAEEHSLLVSLDCGVTSVEIVNVAREIGLDCVITDHHTPSDVLPDCPVVNPMLGGYPFPGLCGAGVAFKVALALRGEAAMEVIDLAAFATVADVVPLTDENRAIVALGLEKINQAPRPGLTALIKEAGLAGKSVSAGTIGFQLGPRINASGRMGDAGRALSLLLAGSAEEAEPFARELETENRSRKSEEERILRQAEGQLAEFDFVTRRAIVLAGEDWNPGVVGLAASRITEKYGYPSVVLTRKGEEYTGSCRSIEGVNIHAALCRCAEHLSKFGGHKQAAGLTLRAEKLPDFVQALDTAIWEISRPEDFVPCVKCDMEYPVEKLTVEALEMLEKMEPTGMGNPSPLFSAQACVAAARGVGADGAHLKLTFSDGERNVDGIWFGEGARAAQLVGEEVRFAYSASVNRYMGRVTPQCMVKRALPDTREQAKRAFAQKESSLRIAYLTNVLYNKNIIHLPAERITREDVVRMLLESPQGTLVAALTKDALELPNADYLLGTWPQGSGAHNAVCICPAGELPRGYKRIVLWDVPPEMASAGDEWTGDCAEWLKEMPDLEKMREIYRQARSGRTPQGAGEWAGMILLEQLGLIESGWANGRPVIRPSGRVDMENDDTFRRLQQVRLRAQQRRGAR